ncbi:MAG: FMN-binding protein [Clostridia bacterium]|nr:FMN-binding protein [Clostridia bacterium]
MDIKKSLKDVVVLVAICSFFAVVLALTNSVTAPLIEKQMAAAADEAYMAVMPDAKGFETVDLTGLTLPATVIEAKRETSGMGYAIKLETKGYGTGMILIVGVSADGVVTGATCVTSNETNGDEKTYGGNFSGKDMAGVEAVELIAGSTMTTKAYRSAVVDAINAATILGGGSADLRTEEEIVNDTLPAGEGKFIKFTVVDIDGNIYTYDDLSIKGIYEATNGAGYVCIVGKDYVAFDADGNILSEVSAENKEIIDNVIAKISANKLTNVDLAEFSGINSLITSVKKTESGIFVIDVNGEGYGIKGDMDGYTHGNGEYIRICVTLSAEGRVIDSVVLSHSETPDYVKDNLEDGKYNSNFIGKDQTESGKVNVVAGSTLSTRAYKQAILYAFEAYVIIEGGAN